MTFEVTVGIISSSLALLSDAWLAASSAVVGGGACKRAVGAPRRLV